MSVEVPKPATDASVDRGRRAGKAACESGDKYRTLFASIEQGFCIIEVLFDESLNPVDYRFLEINPAFERQTGLDQAAGKRMLTLAPEHERHWFEIYGRVALTGEPVQFENRAEALGDRWYEVSAFRVGEPEQRQVAILFNDITDRRRAEAALRESEADLLRNQVWLAAQKEAFQVAMDHGSLEASLGVLTKAVAEQADDGRRCAFYLANGRRDRLTHVVGMPPAYIEALDALEVFPESLARGLAVATGRPVLTPDLLEEPRWQPWARLAREYGYRGCWSFPVETVAGRLVGSFAVYLEEPHEPEQRDLELVTMITQTAAIIISHHRENEERIRSEERFRQFADASSSAIWIRAADTLAMEYVGPAIRTIYGTETDTMLGDVERWLTLVMSEDRAAVLDHLERARGGEAVVHQFRIERASDRAVRWIRNTDFPLRDDKGDIERVGGISEDVTDAKLAVEHQAMLLAELQHRVRNILAVVRLAFARTTEADHDLADMVRHFDGRLASLARTQVLITRNPDGLTDLEGLLRDELLSVGVSDGAEVHLDGPDVLLPAKSAELLGLAIHELTTNALKYGALKIRRARLDIRWEIEADGNDERLEFSWSEQGVPIVPLMPVREGFGRELIEKALPYQLDAATRLEFHNGGIRCHISLPLYRNGETPSTL